MQTANIRYQFNLRWKKASLILSFLALVVGGYAQSIPSGMNNPNYDNRLFSYGFLIGIHNTGYQLRYSDAFVQNDLDTIHSILPKKSPGFSLGFIINMRLDDFLDLRMTPKVAFYERELEYNFVSDRQEVLLQETTVVEFPLLLKYKSKRRGNIRMYLVGGIKPSFEASGRDESENSGDPINIQRFDTALETGIGFDLYFPLFKFSPEIRYSKGLVNILSPSESVYSQGISRLSANTIHLYFLFQ